MKLLMASLALTLSSSFAAANATPALKRISCVASNGTTLETVGRRATGLALETRLGLFVADFTAELVLDEETQKTTVELTDETGRISYLLDLTIDVKSRKQQTRAGTIIRTGDGYVAPAVVATTLCDLSLRK